MRRRTRRVVKISQSQTTTTNNLIEHLHTGLQNIDPITEELVERRDHTGDKILLHNNNHQQPKQTINHRTKKLDQEVLEAPDPEHDVRHTNTQLQKNHTAQLHLKIINLATKTTHNIDVEEHIKNTNLTLNLQLLFL